MKVETKKKQHYVPRGYLKHWIAKRRVAPGEKENGLWVSSIHKKEDRNDYFCTDLRNISQKRYFNNIIVDEDVYDLLCYKYHDSNEIVIGLIGEIEILLKAEIFSKNTNYENRDFDNFRKQYLEEKFSKFEGVQIAVLDELNNDIIKYIKGLESGVNDLRDFVGIFFMQLLRTKKARLRLNNYMESIFIHRDGKEKKLNNEQKENYIKIMLFIEPIVISERLFKNGFSIELLVSTGAENFFTSNSPAVLFNGDTGEDISKIHGFMPLSPKSGLIIRGSKIDNKNLIVRTISDDEVNEYNEITKNNADDEIYSSYDITSRCYNKSKRSDVARCADV
jgi:hypothetical protein